MLDTRLNSIKCVLVGTFNVYEMEIGVTLSWLSHHLTHSWHCPNYLYELDRNWDCSSDSSTILYLKLSATSSQSHVILKRKFLQAGQKRIYLAKTL